MYKSRVLVACGALACLAGPAQAEYFGLPNGRAADLSTLPDTSVEAGFVTGDVGEAEYQHIGARVNYRLDPQIMLYGDVGQSEIEDADGTTFGIGAYYQTEGIFPSIDFTVKGSFHLGELKDDADFDVDAISFEGLFSGQDPIGESDLRWYANVGIHRLAIDAPGSDDSETDIGFGGGVFTSVGSGQLYGGIDLIDEITFGVGYRYFLN